MKLVFWQKIISIHQVFYLKELAKTEHVILAVQHTMSVERKKQGWEKPDTGNIEVVFIKNKKECDDFIKKSQDAHHIFSGFKGNEIQNYAFKTLIKNTKVGIIAESAIQLGKITLIKRLQYYWLAKKYNSKISFILAMGKTGTEWYRKAGFCKDKIYQFQYFTELPINYVQKKREVSEKIRFTYVGQLIYRKGIDILLQAFFNAHIKNSELNIIGTGVLEEKLKKRVQENGLKNKIIFHGNKKNIEILDFLETQTDYLILPSRFDGWGAVVNESLSVGTPAIVSASCGAEALITDSRLGHVYHQEKDLENILKKIDQHKTTISPDSVRNLYQQEFTYKKVEELKHFLKKHGI